MSALQQAVTWGGGSLSRPSRRDVLAGSLLLATAAASQLLKPTRSSPPLAKGALDAAIPKTIGALRFVTSSGLVLPPKDELSDRLYDEVLTRVYGAEGMLPVLALFAYGSVQNLSLELHRPEECYPQQGFTITRPERLPLQLAGKSIPASALTARRESGYVEQVVYWSRIGSHFPASKTEQSWIVAQENFSGRTPDGILARLSVPTPDRGLGVRTAEGFLRNLAGALSAGGRQIVFGEKKDPSA
jgi:EpsI family protein